MVKRFELVLAAAALLATPVAAQIALKHALPENTILYVGAPDISTSMGEMKDMPLMRMWHEEEVQDFFADALLMGQDQWKQLVAQGAQLHEGGMLPFHPDDLMKLRVEGMGIALTSLGMTGGGPDGEATFRDMVPSIGVVAQFDFGESAATWRKLIEFGLSQMEQASQGELTQEVTQVGDATVITLIPSETDMSINFAFAGTGLVFGTGRDEVKQILNNLADDKKVLSASKNFTTTFDRLDADGAELELFMQPGPVIDFAMGVLQMASDEAPGFPKELSVEGIDRALTALGIRDLHAIGSTSTYVSGDEGSRSVSKSFALAPAATRRGLLSGSDKHVDMSFLKWVPKDAASFSAMTFDLASIYDGVIGALKVYDEDMANMMLGMLSQHEEQAGMSIRDDLVGALGNQFMSWSMPVAAFGTTPETAMLVEVKDQQKLLNTLQTIAKMSDGMIELNESERRGITVHTLQVNYDPTGGGMGMNPFEMFVPTFSFKDGYLVAGFSTGDVKRVFKRMDREDDPEDDIRGNAEFKPYLQSVPTEGLASVSFSDWKANFEGIYQLVTSMAAFIPMDDRVPVDLSLLPDVTTLTQHLYGGVSWSVADDEGFHSFSQGPWGPETIALFGGLVGAGAGVAGAMESGMIR